MSKAGETPPIGRSQWPSTDNNRARSSPRRREPITRDQVRDCMNQSSAVKAGTIRHGYPHSDSSTRETEDKMGLLHTMRLKAMQFLKDETLHRDCLVRRGDTDDKELAVLDGTLRLNAQRMKKIDAEIARLEGLTQRTSANGVCAAFSKSVSRRRAVFRWKSGLGVTILFCGAAATGYGLLVLNGGTIAGIVGAAGGFLGQSRMDAVHGMEETNRRQLSGGLPIHPVGPLDGAERTNEQRRQRRQRLIKIHEEKEATRRKQAGQKERLARNAIKEEMVRKEEERRDADENAPELLDE